MPMMVSPFDQINESSFNPKLPAHLAGALAIDMVDFGLCSASASISARNIHDTGTFLLLILPTQTHLIIFTINEINIYVSVVI